MVPSKGGIPFGIFMEKENSRQKAQRKYLTQKRFQKTVAFNRESEAELIELAAALPDFSGWVKAHLKRLKDDAR